MHPQPATAPLPRDAPALELASVSVTVADGRPLLHAIDCVVAPGEHWAIVGANGAGKTTLLDVIAGDRAPSAGRVRVLGEDHGAVGFRDPRLRIGRIDATPRTFARSLTATDVVVLRPAGPIALRGERIDAAVYAHARELLDRFGCGPLAGRRYQSCSQGERQRIQLARALMRDPALLLLDEPAAALDLVGRDALLDAMARLAGDRPRLATVTVTHHLEELAPSTTHALLLRDGCCVASGPVDAVLTEPLLSEAFGVPVAVHRLGDRRFARVRREALRGEDGGA
jgi:iron complex transport system ATP-binding protein